MQINFEDSQFEDCSLLLDNFIHCRIKIGNLCIRANCTLIFWIVDLLATWITSTRGCDCYEKITNKFMSVNGLAAVIHRLIYIPSIFRTNESDSILIEDSPRMWFFIIIATFKSGIYQEDGLFATYLKELLEWYIRNIIFIDE